MGDNLVPNGLSRGCKVLCNEVVVLGTERSWRRLSTRSLSLFSSVILPVKLGHRRIGIQHGIGKTLNFPSYFSMLLLQIRSDVVRLGYQPLAFDVVCLKEEADRARVHQMFFQSLQNRFLDMIEIVGSIVIACLGIVEFGADYASAAAILTFEHSATTLRW
jgi:hypothetical protein